MTRCIFSILISTLLLSTTHPSHAEVYGDGLYSIETTQDFIIENRSGYLHKLLCKDGLLQAPAVGLNVFFTGDLATHVIDHDNSNYLLTGSIDFDENRNFHQINNRMTRTIHGEPAFDSGSASTFTLRAASALLDSEGLLTSTCLAQEGHDLQEVNS